MWCNYFHNAICSHALFIIGSYPLSVEIMFYEIKPRWVHSLIVARFWEWQTYRRLQRNISLETSESIPSWLYTTPLGEGVYPYIGYRYVRPKRVWFSDVLSIFWPFWSYIRYGFYALTLNWICFFKKKLLLIIWSSSSIFPSTSSLHKLSAAMVINRVYRIFGQVMNR